MPQACELLFKSNFAAQNIKFALRLTDRLMRSQPKSGLVKKKWAGKGTREKERDRSRVFLPVRRPRKGESIRCQGRDEQDKYTNPWPRPEPLGKQDQRASFRSYITWEPFC